MSGIGGHTAPNEGATDVWLTPPELLALLGDFDLDPCSPVDRPWDTAARHYTIHDNGLVQPWAGRVWMNPPYGKVAGAFLQKLAIHNNGTALIFARTETEMFFDWVWPFASAMIFIEKRLYFHRPDGVRAKGNSGGPSVLIAYGDEEADRLLTSMVKGARIDLRNQTPVPRPWESEWLS